MLEKSKLDLWKKSYWEHIKRNIGFITAEEQEKVRNSRIVVFGLGGLGGSLSEQLVRSGCEKLIICDNEKFEESNLNRQICFRKDLNNYKVNVIENFLKNINPDIDILKFYEINNENIINILKKVKLAVLTLDDPIKSILIARKCKILNIPLLESWGIPYLWLWWFTSESIDFEFCYDLKTQNMKIKEIENDPDMIKSIKKAIINVLMKFPNIIETYNRENGILKGMVSNKIPFVSIAPVVRINASYLAFDLIYSGLLNLKPKNLAPKVVGYDYIRMRPIEFDIN